MVSISNIYSFFGNSDKIRVYIGKLVKKSNFYFVLKFSTDLAVTSFLRFMGIVTDSEPFPNP